MDFKKIYTFTWHQFITVDRTQWSFFKVMRNYDVTQNLPTVNDAGTQEHRETTQGSSRFPCPLPLPPVILVHVTIEPTLKISSRPDTHYGLVDFIAFINHLEFNDHPGHILNKPARHDYQWKDKFIRGEWPISCRTVHGEFGWRGAREERRVMAAEPEWRCRDEGKAEEKARNKKNETKQEPAKEAKEFQRMHTNMYTR